MFLQKSFEPIVMWWNGRSALAQFKIIDDDNGNDDKDHLF